MERRPRICVYSQRGLHSHVARCSEYEFEDVIADVDDVDIVVSEPTAASSIGRRISNRLARHLRVMPPNPGLSTISLNRDYDLFFALCMFPSDLGTVQAIRDWRTRCNLAVCWLDEVWAANLSMWRGQLKLLAEFDIVILNNAASVHAVEQATGRPCHYLPLGVDALRFCPYPTDAPRFIDVYSMGRRDPKIHDQLLNLTDRYYVYDTVRRLEATSWVEHRSLVASTAKRSMFFIVQQAKEGRHFETKGQSEIGSRYFEGAAAGTVMLGSAPETAEWITNFGWRDSVIPFPDDVTNVRDWLRDLTADTERLARVRYQNVVNSLRRHDWSYRWADVLRLAEMTPLDALHDRIADLQAREAFAAGAVP